MGSLGCRRTAEWVGFRKNCSDDHIRSNSIFSSNFRRMSPDVGLVVGTQHLPAETDRAEAATVAKRVKRRILTKFNENFELVKFSDLDYLRGVGSATSPDHVTRLSVSLSLHLVLPNKTDRSWTPQI